MVKSQNQNGLEEIIKRSDTALRIPSAVKCALAALIQTNKRIWKITMFVTMHVECIRVDCSGLQHCTIHWLHVIIRFTLWFSIRSHLAGVQCNHIPMIEIEKREAMAIGFPLFFYEKSNHSLNYTFKLKSHGAVDVVAKVFRSSIFITYSIQL